MNDQFCSACGTGIDAQDNFCRRCGLAVRQDRLPAVRGATAPTLWRPQVSPAVKGAAVMAAGTIGQFLFRRAVSGVFGGGTRKTNAIKIRRPRERDGMVDEAQIITETVTMRRVRIRRQA
jgi:hypothetical protein